jgi:hypothetical protein
MDWIGLNWTGLDCVYVFVLVYPEGHGIGTIVALDCAYPESRARASKRVNDGNNERDEIKQGKQNSPSYLTSRDPIVNAHFCARRWISSFFQRTQ